MTAIVDTDIKHFLTITTGGAGNAAAQPDPNASLGKFCSTTELVDATPDNLFDNISGDENAASDVEYRCIVIANDTASGNSWTAPKAWIASEVAGGASIAIGLDPIGVVAKAAQVAAVIANENTAPAGVAFSAPTTKTAGLTVADVPPGSCFALWFRRTAANTSAVNNDGATYTAEGDTAA